MHYLNDLLSLNGKFSNIKKGLIYIKSLLHLDLVKIDKMPHDSRNVEDPVRNCQLSVTELLKTKLTEDQILDILGERYKDRRQTKVYSQGTVYGRDSRVRLDYATHSFYGMNPAYLNDVGVPNPVAIQKRLREIAPSMELKEQRLNNYINSVVVGDFYDNATAYLYVLLQRLQIAKLFRLVDQKRHKYSVRASTILNWHIKDANDIYVRLSQMLNSGEFRMQCAAYDLHLHRIAGDILEWYKALPPSEIDSGNGQMTKNAAFYSMVYDFEVKYWECYDYNDGHSKSGNHFGDVFGMIHNRYKVPELLLNSNSYSTNFVSAKDYQIPLTDSGIAGLGKINYFINGTGLSTAELAVASSAMAGNKRSTPFLVDQDIDFDLDDKTKCYIFRNDINEQEMQNVSMTETLIKSTITKLVATHKWYEELRAASVLMRNWIAQPATETVEAHWWLNIHRTLYLPKLGLKRAILPMLTEGEGANISKEAFEVSKAVVSQNDSLIIESFIVNTLWYWGEYLNQYNSTTLRGLIERNLGENFDTLQDSKRANALMSAVLGTAVPQCIFPMCYTNVTRGLTSHYKDVVKFGEINILAPEEHGYTVSATTMLANSIVCPGGTGIIAGLGGSLLNGTPYGAIFNIDPVVYRHVDGRSVPCYRYYDLWAYGVVQRWQGYNVWYLHPKGETVKHRIYAANNVSIAMPPVTPISCREPRPYIMKSDTEREHVFGSSIEHLRSNRLTYTWRRTRMEVLEEPEYNASPVCADTRSYMDITRLTYSDQLLSKQNVLLYAKFDADNADFQIEYPELAVPLEIPVGTLQLQDSDTGPPPEPDSSGKQPD